MLRRNLVYTGVTWKRLVVLVGQRKALAIAVKGDRKRGRWSKLREWLALNAKASPVLVTLFTRSGCYAGLSLARVLIGRKDLAIVFWSPVSLKRRKAVIR